MSDPDPSSIRSLAVAAEDVVDAAIYNRENPGTAVLRVTPPFHGRMRARLHVFHDEGGRVSGAIHLEPTDLLEGEVLEAYPAFDDQLGADASDPDQFRERRERELERWRERASNAICESVVLEAADGERVSGPIDGEPAGGEPTDGDEPPHRVDVKRLG